MPLDPSLTGRSYPVTAPYEVGREKIREFADAIGAPEAAHRDPDAAKALGHPDVIAPPTFPVVFGFGPAIELLVTDPEVGLDYARVVHGDQRFSYHRPVRAGDRLVSHNSIEEVMSRAGNDFITVRSETFTVEGEPVVTMWCRLVVRGEGA